MSKRLIIQNNIYLLPKIAKNYDSILYAPIYKSNVQKVFFEKRFDEIRNKFNEVVWTEEIESIEATDDFLSWDAIYEKEAFGDNILKTQNRLFDKLDFEVKDSFTNFRKKAESSIPEYFANVNIPYDREVLDELNYYFEKNKLALTYFETRNDLLGRDFSTKFSKYLSCGALDVRYLYNRVKDFERTHERNKSTYWIVFELLWREFFYWHYHNHKSKYFSENGIKGTRNFSQFETKTISELMALSPNNFFTAALTELVQTGYLSNRVRQIFASIWLNDLNLNWRSGAELFENYLVDYDVYSNYGNWMYLAGVGCDPRGRRYFKVEKQLNQYDPSFQYIKKWTGSLKL